MTNYMTEHFQAYRDAIQKTAQDGVVSVPPCPAKHFSADDYADTLAAFLADGNAGAVVFVAGREFAGEVLKNIGEAGDSELREVLREAIQGSISIFDQEGTPGAEFRTKALNDLLARAGSRVDLQADTPEAHV